MLNHKGITENFLNILVAEDEADTRQVISVLLTRPGHVVHAVADGLEAVRSIKERDYDILIADIKMPHLDGISLLRKARQLRPGMACIVLTGHSDREYAMEALELEAYDFIAKPFMIDQLLPAIGRISQKIKTLSQVRSKSINLEEVPAFIERLMRKGPVYAPVKKGNSHHFAQIGRASEAVLEYTSTILPPKKIFLPPEESLIEFDRALGAARPVALNYPDITLLAVHPCDMQAILRLDRVFLEENPESSYARRRRAATIVGSDCIPDEKCFCRIMDARQTQEGFDLFLSRLGDKLRVDILTESGERLLEGFSAVSDELLLKEGDGEAGSRRFQPQNGFGCNAASLPELLRLAWDDEIWSKAGDDCLSCGSCTMVCPTCHCFDVQDIPSLDGRTGTRCRRWDSCQLECFAAVAGGGNFRKSRAERIHHRFAHKFSYFHEKTGINMCVGCGRCARACPSGIEPPKILRRLCGNHKHSLLLRAYNFWQ